MQIELLALDSIKRTVDVKLNYYIEILTVCK